MQLIREHWTAEDGKEFQKYLRTFARNEDKCAWEKRIVNTQMECLAIISGDVRRIISLIKKGNFLEFLDLGLWETFTNTTINGGLICEIKDFSLQKRYLIDYLHKIDNWASCDCLKLKINRKNKSDYFALAKELIADKHIFTRRAGMTILFKMIDDDYIQSIFDILDSFSNETEYYVNMVNAWLVAECFTKQRERTLNWLSHNKLNTFTINKAVQKCRDSFRISQEDKDMLLRFKR